MNLKLRPAKGLVAFCLIAGLVVRSWAVDAAGAGTSTSEGSQGNLAADAVASSVVKVFATVRYPDPFKPWTKQAPTDVTGSGVVLKNKRILTNAHLVLYASQVQVQAYQSGSLLPATVEAVAPGIDLAVLRLEDDAFFDSHPPLAWAPAIPQTEDPVMVYGYPLGGTSLSITKGIISRIEFTSYNFPVSGLRIQIDAAINHGNSGGPAVVDGKMIGIAYSRLGGSTQNIGYILPCEEIELFLNGLAQGHYDCKPGMSDECEVLGNPTLHAFLKLASSVNGIVVTKPAGATADYPLKKWDVITKIGDTPVDDQGMVNLNHNLRVYFKYLIQKLARDGTVPLTILRAGKEMRIQLPVAANEPRLISDLNGAYPSYFVYGPLVFSSATSQFVDGLMAGNMGASRMVLLDLTGSPLAARMGDKPAFEGEQLVVVSSPFFPHKLAKGFANPIAQVVKTVNGIPIQNLKHLAEVLRDSRDEFITLEFVGRAAPILVFPRTEMSAATDSILVDNDIRSQGTPDVMAVWNAKPAAR